jgi:Bifunctional DNA primase/polymerase, N-terminal
LLLANIGIALGRQSRLAAVDLEGVPGRETLKHLVGDNCPTCARKVTAGRVDGGQRLYFLCPEGRRVPTYNYGNLEVPAEGAYVVAPSSLHRPGSGTNGPQTLKCWGPSSSS